MAAPRYILIANPGTKRCEAYRRELLAFWGNNAPVIEIVPWAEVVPRQGNLDGLAAFDAPAIVRIESPGKNPQVMRLMLEAGTPGHAEPPLDLESQDFPKGLLFRPGRWFRGFRSVLEGLRKSFDGRPHLQLTACPLAIARMFDKTITATTLRAAAIPTPDWLENPFDVFEMVRQSGPWPSAYLKLNAGSSAMGMIRLRTVELLLHGDATLIEIDGRFFNSRRVAELEYYAGRRAAAFILAEGAFAQEGKPMAKLEGQNCDLRVVCVYGKPVATIFRLSPHPMTNLHLGGRRGDFARCRAAIPTRYWLDAMDHCSAAAGCFDSAIAGVDLLFEPGFQRQHVLEVNAFGDFFPGWVNSQGQSLHAIEIEATARRFHHLT